ncbi:MAG: hypothetical protein JNK38_11195 [Acidobacteria bacterium]|nr:hypothetical protein [Acidobacteriota bacterium]
MATDQISRLETVRKIGRDFGGGDNTLAGTITTVAGNTENADAVFSGACSLDEGIGGCGSATSVDWQHQRRFIGGLVKRLLSRFGFGEALSPASTA